MKVVEITSVPLSIIYSPEGLHELARIFPFSNPLWPRYLAVVTPPRYAEYPADEVRDQMPFCLTAGFVTD